MPRTSPLVATITRQQVVLVLLAVAARVAYWLLTLHYTPISDAGSYNAIASNLAAGRGFSDTYPQVALHATAFRPPGYPGLLGALYVITSPLVAAGRLLNLILGVAVVLCVELLVRRMAGPLAGFAAAAAVALYPPLVVNDVTLLGESLALLLLVSVLIALQSDRLVVAAVLTGALLLTRHSAQFLPVLLALLMHRVGARRALMLAIVPYVVVVPWVVRNEIQLGAPVLNTANGFNLAAMYSPQAHATGGFVNPYADDRFGAVRSAQRDEAAWDRKLRDLGIEGLREHPFDPIRVTGHNFLQYFELTPSRNVFAEVWDGRNLTVRRWSLPLFYAVVVVGVTGLFLYRRDPTAKLIIGCAAYFTVVSLVTVTAPRLRSPLDLACCIGVGLVVARIGERRSQRIDATDAALTHEHAH